MKNSNQNLEPFYPELQPRSGSLWWISAVPNLKRTSHEPNLLKLPPLGRYSFNAYLTDMKFNSLELLVPGSNDEQNTFSIFMKQNHLYFVSKCCDYFIL